MVSYGIISIGELKSAKKRSRDFFVGDLRNRKYEYRDMKMLLGLLEVIPPTLNQRANRPVAFEEVVLHKRLKDYNIPFPNIATVLRPDQKMCNAISEIIASAANVQPPFEPYVVVDVKKPPWRVGKDEHDKAIDAFERKMKKYNTTQPMSMQQFLLYKWRFIIAADMCKAWDRFGGIASQINNIAIITNMSIVDNPFVAIKYDEALSARLAAYARERTPDINYASILSAEDFELKRYIINQSTASSANNGPRIVIPPSTIQAVQV